MVVHWFRYKDDPHWQVSAVINTVGAITTGVVFSVIAIAKFSEGAWIVVVLVPIMVAYFLWVKRRYDTVRAELALPADELADLNWQSYNRLHNHVVVLVKEHRPPSRPRAPVRQDAAGRLGRGDLRRRERRGGRGVPQARGTKAEHGHPAHRHRVAVPRGHLAARRLRARHPAARRRTTSSRSSCPSTRR